MTNLTFLDTIANDDQDLALALSTMFIEQNQEFIETINTAIADKNDSLGKKTAHTFKGVCLNLGFEQTGALCKTLETDFETQNYASATQHCALLHTHCANLVEKLEKFIAERAAA